MKPAWTFLPPRAGNPPADTWLPQLLSDEDRRHRAEQDRALMVANRADKDEISNASILQGELQAGKYDEIESQLGAVQAKFQTDPAFELVLRSSANFAQDRHTRSNFLDTALIQAWVKARPNSAWAHYAAGRRWSSMAWEARGNGWANDITEEQWKKVHEDEVNARTEVETALKINPRISIAWVTLMDIDRTDPGAGLDQVTADFDQASKQVPTSYLVADQYEETLEPRWMGSAEMMDDFARSELSNLDRNPLFWGLQGDSLADSGCAACNDYRWDVSLKEYNAALTFADSPIWLAAAGEAAMHLHRYALAHAYYERALAYEDDLYWRMYRDLTVELCDPSKTPEEVERYRRDVVMSGGLDDVKYPHGPNDCVVYQRELPWGTEPLPDTTGLRVYAIDPIGHPAYEKEPQTTELSGPVKSVTSPDGTWVVTSADGGDKTKRLELHSQATGKTTGIYTFTSDVTIGFTSDSKRLFVSDWTLGKEEGCHYIDPSDPIHQVDLKEKMIQWATDQHVSIELETVQAPCSAFINDDMLMASLAGQMNGKRVFRMFHYEISSGNLVALPQ